MAADLAAIEARLAAAFGEVVRICWGGHWRMTIPADEAHDSDCLITASLSDLRALLADLRATRAALVWIDDHAYDRTPTEIQHFARRVRAALGEAE